MYLQTMTESKAVPEIPYVSVSSCSKGGADPGHAHDAKAAHFLRHEVKNGVLAAMGLVENLQEVYRKYALDNSTSTSNDSPLVQHLAELNSTLGHLLGTVVDNAMTLEVVHGDYVPTQEPVHLPSLLTTQDAHRFPILSGTDFPTLLLDPNLVRTVHSKALSNACKFGQPEGVVKTYLSYNHSAQTFTMQVENLPGPGHEQLLQLTPQEQETIFQEQTQLPCHQHQLQGAHQVELRSEGNGAWIMQHCARTMGGHCSVLFEPHRTVLSLECPATPVPAATTKPTTTPTTTTTTNSSSFQLPSNTYCIVVEDSAVQRKMLQRYLARAGLKKERCIIWGSTPQEILDFVPRAHKLIQEHPRDTFLILMDEHLDILEGGLVSKTVSGSYAVQQLRRSIHPRQEARLLALIRSANDSSHEQRLYQERAHGFLSKGPLKQGNLLQAIQPWWERRFASTLPAQLDHQHEPLPPFTADLPKTPFSPQVPPRKRSRRTLALPTTLNTNTNTNTNHHNTPTGTTTRTTASTSTTPPTNRTSFQHLQKARSTGHFRRLPKRDRDREHEQSLLRTKSTTNCNAYWDHKTISQRLNFPTLSTHDLSPIPLRSYKSTPALAHNPTPTTDRDRSLSCGQSHEGLRNFFFARA